jgi:hypothetical protein
VRLYCEVTTAWRAGYERQSRQATRATRGRFPGRPFLRLVRCYHAQLAMSEVKLSELTAVVIHDGDEEEVYICLNSEIAWAKAGNQMMAWLGDLQSNYLAEDEELRWLKEKIENHDYAGAAEMWNEMTNGDQYFQVDTAAVLTTEPQPTWPAEVVV